MTAPAHPDPAEPPASRTARPDFRLIARFLVRADSPMAADRLQARLVGALHDWAATPQTPPEPYWKEAGSFDISLLLHPADVASFDRVLGLAARSWWVSRDVECSAVWNPEPGHELIDPAVFWAELILCHAHAADTAPDATAGS
jgi:plasmid stabilization system protein ParE